MQPQTEGGSRGIGAHDPIREGRVADRKIEAAAEPTPRVVLAADRRLGMDEAGDPRRHRAIFDAGKAGRLAQLRRHRREKQPGSHARLEHNSASEAEPLCGTPQRADDRLRRVVRILRRALEYGVFGRADTIREIAADLVPAGAETGGARQRKAVLCELGGAEPGKAQHQSLFIDCRRSSGLLDLLREPDGGDVVPRPRRPAVGKTAIGVELEVFAASRCRRRIGSCVVELGWRRLACRLFAFRGLDGPIEGGAVEQAEGRRCGVGHRRNLLLRRVVWAQAGLPAGRRGSAQQWVRMLGRS